MTRFAAEFSNIPRITKFLLIANFVVFILQYLSRDLLTYLLSLHYFTSEDFHFFQLFSYMFLHGGFSHLFFNMFALWMFGQVIENHLGTNRFLIYYLVCGIGAGLIQELSWYWSGVNPYFVNQYMTVGASGAIFGILLAFGLLFPNQPIFLFFIPIPIKAKYFVTAYALIELYSGVHVSAGDNVAHFAHLGGMIFGFLLIRYWQNNSSPNSLSKKMERSFNKTKDFFLHLFANEKNEPFGRSSVNNSQKESDADWNERKAKEEKEIDDILDKIKKNGYDSLSQEEKEKLFRKRRN